MATENWKTEIVRKLNSDSTLRGLVGNRVYPAFLANIKDPKFPCINFFSEGGSKTLSYVSYALMSVRFWVYSQKSFNEVDSIMDRVLVALNNQVVTSTDGTYIFEQFSEPVELADEDLRGSTLAFTVRKV